MTKPCWRNSVRLREIVLVAVFYALPLKGRGNLRDGHLPVGC